MVSSKSQLECGYTSAVRTDADASDVIVHVRLEETSVFTQHSCRLIANSSIDDLAILCDDALGGGIREQKYEKQKYDEQTIFDVQEARDALRRNLTRSLTAKAIHKRTTHFRFREWCLACVVGVAKDWPHRLRRVSSELLIVFETLLGHCFLGDVRSGS